MTTRGVLYVHSAPRALCPHVEWAVGGVLGARVQLDWIRQPAAPGTWRAEFSWRGETGTASKLASALRGWQMLRFEVTSEPCATAEGERYSATPDLGIFHAVTGMHGDILVPEDRLRAALRGAGERGAEPVLGDEDVAVHAGDGMEDAQVGGGAVALALGGRAGRDGPGGRGRPTPRQALGRRTRTLPLRRRGRPGPLASPGRLSPFTRAR